ncbi:hypothetical protein HDU86_008517 [Geranomyces michiganensis]|nr:hypothetical protein HDU86_008517 [Geranomyces michiganensis]
MLFNLWGETVWYCRRLLVPRKDIAFARDCNDDDDDGNDDDCGDGDDDGDGNDDCTDENENDDDCGDGNGNRNGNDDCGDGDGNGNGNDDCGNGDGNRNGNDDCGDGDGNGNGNDDCGNGDQVQKNLSASIEAAACGQSSPDIKTSDGKDPTHNAIIPDAFLQPGYRRVLLLQASVGFLHMCNVRVKEIHTYGTMAAEACETEPFLPRQAREKEQGLPGVQLVERITKSLHPAFLPRFITKKKVDCVLFSLEVFAPV